MRARTQQVALEQDVARLQAGLARQNAVLWDLQERDRNRERELQTLRQVQAGLMEQNRLLRQQVAELRQENTRLRGKPLASLPDPAPEVKPSTPQREPKVRKKRAAEQNHGRHKLTQATRWETHAADTCSGCGAALSGGASA